MLFRSASDWVLNEGYTKPGVTVVSVAKELNTNRTYLSAYIHHMYGCSFRDWVNNLRVEKAKELMKTYPSKVNDSILEEVGYLSRSHFIRIFTDIVGVSPSEWRNENV